MNGQSVRYAVVGNPLRASCAMRRAIHGAARDGLDFDHLYEGGVDLALGTSEALGFVSEVTAGTSYTWAEDFEGLRIGFGASF